MELNLDTAEESRPIYVCSLLTPEAKNKYFNLLSEYKEVFA